MRCPRDGATLQRVSILGVDLDKCHQCDGIWCDWGEVEQLAKAKITDVEQAIEEKHGDPTSEQGSLTGYMQCPKCDGRLQQICYSFINPIKIDRCEKCLGVWLDDKELNAIASEKKQLDEDFAPSQLQLVLQSVSRFFSDK